MVKNKQFSLEDVFIPKGEYVNKAKYGYLMEEQQVFKTEKDVELCGVLGDLEQIGNKLEILDFNNPSIVVRQIEITKDKVIIDGCDGSKPFEFPKNTSVYYEDWFMDRGSYLIWIEVLDVFGKLATENDPIRRLKE